MAAEGEELVVLSKESQRFSYKLYSHQKNTASHSHTNTPGNTRIIFPFRFALNAPFNLVLT